MPRRRALVNIPCSCLLRISASSTLVSYRMRVDQPMLLGRLGQSTG